MTSTCTVHTIATPSLSSPFTFSARHSLRSTTPASADARHVRSKSGQALSTMKKSIGSKEAKEAIGMLSAQTDDSGPESGGGLRPRPRPHAHTQAPGHSQHAQHLPQTQQSHSFFKRLSTFSTSSSSRQSSPNPPSSAATPSNASIAFSTTASTTPILAAQPTPAPSAIPPNKLVKRSISLRPTSSDTSTSKIPKPSLTRPATSHQRSATLQERRTRDIRSAHAAFSQSAPPTDDNTQWRSYFTPKRRHSTSIPNPIRRVYPDRRYRPTLVSAAEPVARARLDFDHDCDDDELASEHNLQLDAAFSPSPLHSPIALSTPAIASARDSVSHLDEPGFEAETSSQLPNPTTRSFSISDWLPGEVQTWRRPLSSASVGRYRRRGRGSPEISSSNTDACSVSNNHSEPPAKRQNVGGVAQASPDWTVSSDQLPGSNISFNEDQLGFPRTSDVLLPASSAQHESQHPKWQNEEMHEDDGPSTPAAASLSRQSTPAMEMSSEAHTAPPASDSHGQTIIEYKTALQRDALFDSAHAMPARNSPGRRGPAIDTIFQESPPPQVHGRHTLLRDILQPGSFQDHGRALRPKHSVIHEEEFLSTPAKSSQRQPTAPSPMSLVSNSSLPGISSSPPEMPSLLQLRHKQHFSDADDDSWSFAGDGDEDDQEQTFPATSQLAHLPLASELRHSFSNPTPADNPQPTGLKSTDKEVRNSIFDWSEQQPFDRSPGGQSPPRPKTVHGKKDAENRGSRSVGRRAPSGVHARSQSVPVAQDAEGKRIQVVTNKFGTWGVGSKGVTEDWNEDFDFGDAHVAISVTDPGEEKRLDSGIGMLVPRSIREQQTNVLANIGLLRDWGLLIEEIKELRMRGIALGLLRDMTEPTWKEVEAMIDLADQESDEHTLAPRFSPPSSPSFNFDAFEEPVPPLPSNELTLLGSPSQDIFNSTSNSTSPPIPIMDHQIHITPATPRRPRKDSEAIARSVIEALQQQRVAPDSAPVLDGRLDKVHFDTATLRRIIPYVQDLRDRVKGILREAEGLYSSPPNYPSGSFEDASFSMVFREAPESPTVRRKTRRSTTTTDNYGSDEGLQSPNDDLATRLRFMAVV